MPIGEDLVRDIMTQGELLKAREDVLDVFDARFGAVSDAVRDRVQATTDRALLKRWHRAVFRPTRSTPPNKPFSKTLLRPVKAGSSPQEALS